MVSRHIPIQLAFMLWLFVPACRDNGRVSGDASQPPQLLALGDSYTIGESVAEQDRWPVQLAAMLREANIDIGQPQIIARTGWTTDELSTGIDTAGSTVKPPYRLVSLMIGVNNQYRGRSIEEFREQFAALLKRAIGFAGGNAKRVIVLSIPDWGVTPFAANSGRERGQVAGEIDAFNALIQQETSRSGGAIFLDVTPISRAAAGDPALIAEDGLHPSPKMLRKWAELALPIAREILRTAPATQGASKH